MNGSGFDWLNIASNSESGSNSPAPPVSFGFNSNSDLNSRNNDGPFDRSNNGNSYKYSNALADQLSYSSPSYPNNQGNMGKYEDDEPSIPLSLTAQELTLEESKTYMRWYSDITGAEAVAVSGQSDVDGLFDENGCVALGFELGLTSVEGLLDLTSGLADDLAGDGLIGLVESADGSVGQRQRGLVARELDLRGLEIV